MKIGPALVSPNNNLSAWFWFGMSLMMLGYVCIQPYLLIKSYKRNERVVIMDDAKVFHVAPVLGLEDAKKMYEVISIQAALVFINRNPNGFDNKEMFKQIFYGEGREKARKLAEYDHKKYNMTKQNVHLKGEVAQFNILEMNPGRVIAQVAGPAMYFGQNKNGDFIDVFDYKLNMELTRNPFLSKRGMTPFVVTNIEYKKRLKGAK